MLQFLVKGTQNSFLPSFNCLWACLFSGSLALSVLCQFDLTGEGRSLLFISANCRSFLLGSGPASSLLMVGQRHKCWELRREWSYAETRIILRVHWPKRLVWESALDFAYLGFYCPTTRQGGWRWGVRGKQGRDRMFSFLNIGFTSQAHRAIPKRKQPFKMS